MTYLLDTQGLETYIRRNRDLARRAECEGNAWLAKELDEVASEAAAQLAATQDEPRMAASF